MTVITILLAALVAAIAFVERIAFAIVIALAAQWVWKITATVRGTVWGYAVVATAFITEKVVQPVRRWWAMRALRAQLAGGATP